MVDPSGYETFVKIHEANGPWMDRDAAAAERGDPELLFPCKIAVAIPASSEGNGCHRSGEGDAPNGGIAQTVLRNALGRCTICRALVPVSSLALPVSSLALPVSSLALAFFFNFVGGDCGRVIA